jgi:hypothetical protein
MAGFDDKISTEPPSLRTPSLRTREEEVAGPSKFSITLELTGAGLGLKVDWEDDTTLFVESIRSGGAVEEWNRLQGAGSKTQVHEGDRLISVNGVTGDPKVMLEQCRGKGRIQVIVERGATASEDGAQEAEESEEESPATVVASSGGLPEAPATLTSVAPSSLATLVPPTLTSVAPSSQAALGFQRGEPLQVWSNSRGSWVEGSVVEYFPMATEAEGYTILAGTLKVAMLGGHKWVMPAQVPTLVRRLG